MRYLSVRVVTYNVADQAPPEDNFDELLGVHNSESKSDVIFVGLQEVEDHEKWIEKFKNTVSPSGYVLLKARNCWAIWLITFIRRNLLVAVTNIESEVTASGTLGVCGNKGGVSVRFELCGVNIIGVNAHFTAHTEKLAERLVDYLEIIQRQSFRDPDVNLILDHDYVLWFGDLNFRVDGVLKEQAEKMISDHKYNQLQMFDQLFNTRMEQKIFENFQEGRLNFAPTFKFDPGTDTYDSSKKQRVPSWTDRILYMAHTDFALDHNVLLDKEGRRMSSQPRHQAVRGPPSAVDFPGAGHHGSIKSNKAQCPEIKLIKYDSLPRYKASDHKPVYAIFEMAIPDLWFSLPIHFISPLGGTHSCDSDLQFEYTLMDPPALNSIAASDCILMPPKWQDNQLHRVRIADNPEDEDQKLPPSDGPVIAVESVFGEKYPDNKFNPNPPPMLATAGLDWIGVYPIDFNDLTSGYSAFVYTAPMKKNESSNSLRNTAVSSAKHPGDELMMGGQSIVINAGLPVGKVFRGKIPANLLDDLQGKTVQLVYYSRSKKCPQGYSKPIKIV